MLFDFEAGQATLFAVSVNRHTLAAIGEQIPLQAIAGLKELEQGHPYAVEDIAALPKRTPIQEKRWAEEGIRSYLNSPLIAQGELIGSLNLAVTTPGPWDTQYIEIAREVSDQLAIALQQARLREQVHQYAQTLEQRMEDRTRELTALYEVSAVASEPLDLNTTLKQLLERVVQAMRGQAGAIHLLDETGKLPTPAAQQGLPPGSHLPGWVLAHAELLIVPYITADPRAGPTSDPTLKAYAGAPMRARGRVLGVLSILRAAGQPQFNVEEVALLTSIADQAGVVVESAWLRQQAEQTAVMQERARLARDLHDSVTQLLYSVNLFATVGREAYQLGDLAQVNHCLVELSAIAQQTLKEMRLLVYELRPPALEHDGLIGALQQRLDAVEKRAGVQAQLLVDDLPELPGSLEEALYRLAQEALNNALKHAAATAITIQIRADDHQIELEVTDNGSGFDPDAGRGGLGLVSMRERAEKLGGLLTILSTPGHGATIKVSLNMNNP
jgi:signal transduction histidine kinase